MSPIGKALRNSLPDFNVTASVDRNSERAILKALEQFQLATQDAIVRKGVRKFLTTEKRQIAARNVAAGLPANDVKAKVKLWRSGIAWGAVGYKTSKPKGALPKGRALRKVYDADGTGWRSHFTELGFHTWAKGMTKPSYRSGRGWKRGIRHRGRGNYIKGTHASQIVHAAMAPMFRESIISAINDAARSSTNTTGTAMRGVEAFF